MTLRFAFNPLLTRRIVAAVGPRGPVLAGLTLLTAGSLAFAFAVRAGSGYAALAAGLVCTGFLVCTGLGGSFARPALVGVVVGRPRPVRRAPPAASWPPAPDRDGGVRSAPARVRGVRGAPSVRP